jgi:hypothetical protein
MYGNATVDTIVAPRLQKIVYEIVCSRRVAAGISPIKV